MGKHIRRLLALALASLLLLAGCGGEEDISGNIETAPPAEAEQDKTLTLGRVEGATYTNTYAGFGCTLDDSWIFYSATELQALPEGVAEIFEEDPKLGEALEELEQITDMMAENAELLCTVNVLFQTVSLQDRLVVSAMSEAEFLQAVIDESQGLFEESYAQVGILLEEVKVAEVEFLGEKRSAISTTGTQEGVPVYMIQLLDYSRGSRSVTVTFTSYLEDNTQTVMDLFYSID